MGLVTLGRFHLDRLGEEPTQGSDPKVHSFGHTEAQRPPSNPLTVGEPLSINHATVQQLQALPRIGPVTAGRIVQYRQRHGPFPGVDELTRVRGIGPHTLEQLRPWIRADPVFDP